MRLEFISIVVKQEAAAPTLRPIFSRWQLEPAYLKTLKVAKLQAVRHVTEPMIRDGVVSSPQLFIR